MSRRLKRAASAAAAAGEEEEEEEKDEDQRGPGLGGLSTSPKGGFVEGSAVNLGAGSTIDLGADAASSVNLEEASYGKGSVGTASRNYAEEPFAGASTRTGRGDGGETFRAHRRDAPGESDDGGGRGDSSRGMLQRSRQGLPAGKVAERAGVLIKSDTESAGRERGGGGYGGSKRTGAGSAGSAGAANADNGRQPSSPRLKRLEAGTKRSGRKRTGDGGDGGGEDGRRRRPRGTRHKVSSVGSTSSCGSPTRAGTTPALRKRQGRSGATLGLGKVGRSRLEGMCVFDVSSQCQCGCTQARLVWSFQPAVFRRLSKPTFLVMQNS